MIPRRPSPEPSMNATLRPRLRSKPPFSEAVASGASKPCSTSSPACTRSNPGYAGGSERQSELRRGLRRPDRPRRSRAHPLRPSQLCVSRSSQRLLLDPRSDDAEPSGQRRRHAIPVGDLLPDAGTARHRRVRHRRAARPRGLWDDPIVTEIADAAPFYEAERYHQEYFARNRRTSLTARSSSRPKVAKFRKHFTERLKRRA